MINQEFKIEKNIPISFSQKLNNTYPFQQMEVGDSFAIKYEDYKDMTNKRLHVCSAFKKFIINNKYAWKYCTRKDNNLKIVRVWRIS